MVKSILPLVKQKIILCNNKFVALLRMIKNLYRIYWCKTFLLVIFCIID